MILLYIAVPLTILLDICSNFYFSVLVLFLPISKQLTRWTLSKKLFIVFKQTESVKF